MTTIDTPDTIGGPDGPRTAARVASTQAILSSPFALTELAATETPTERSFAGTASPFLDGMLSDAGVDAETEMGDLLLAELEDDEFAEVLEALVNEAAARATRGPMLWNEAGGPPQLDSTDAEQWMEAVSDRAIGVIEELERHFGDRSVESIGDEEMDQILSRALPGLEAFVDPYDAQELFLKKLGKKLKKVVKGAKNLVKKGIKLASKVLPIGKILERLKGIIKPLLNRVLAKAIGKLPKSLQEPARRLAGKYGLQQGENFSDYEFLAAEFDAEVAESVLATDTEFASLEAEIQRESHSDSVETNVAVELDRARHRLGQALDAATPGEPPLEAMEQFIPMALLPIAKMGIKIAGRKRVIDFLAGMLAKLIAPVVGKQLARPLSTQIADKGLGLLGLEAEANAGRLGSEAVVAATEEALYEVFTLPEPWLENELLLEIALGEAFHAAAMRHVPDTALRSELAAEQGGSDRGVWLMMPRSTGPAYRYKQYSKRLPVKVTPSLARSVVFSGGETLDDRLHDEGLDNYPVDVELEFFELLPGGELGHIEPMSATTGTQPTTATTLEFDTLEDPSRLPLPEGERRRGRRGSPARTAARRARGASRTRVRVTARGRALRRNSPVSVRLDLSGNQPVVRLHVTIGERRALAVVEKLGQQQHRDVLAMFTKLAEGPAREHVAKRLHAMFAKREIQADEGTAQALSGRLFDGFVAALGSQIEQLSSTLISAAKDPAPGLTVTAGFTFPSKEALTAGEPEAPGLTVRPGRHRD